MRIDTIAQTTGATIVCGAERTGDTLEYGFSSDLMSDVLTITADRVLLISGLVAVQTVRTAMVADIFAILFVRNKPIPDDVVRLAREQNMVIMRSPLSMFRASALLASAGMKPVY